MVTNSDDICSNDFQHLHCGASSDLAITSEPACGSVSASCECPGLPHFACLCLPSPNAEMLSGKEPTLPPSLLYLTQGVTLEVMLGMQR